MDIIPVIIRAEKNFQRNYASILERNDAIRNLTAPNNDFDKFAEAIISTLGMQAMNVYVEHLKEHVDIDDIESIFYHLLVVLSTMYSRGYRLVLEEFKKED